MANITITDIDNGPVLLDGGVFEDALLTFAGTDTFPAGTIFARNTAAPTKFVPFVKGGSTNGNGVPRAIATHEISKTGAGDLPVRLLVAGRVSQRRLIIDAQGDGSAVDGNVLDQLRETGLIPENVVQLSRDDNPQEVDS